MRVESPIQNQSYSADTRPTFEKSSHQLTHCVQKCFWYLGSPVQITALQKLKAWRSPPGITHSFGEHQPGSGDKPPHAESRARMKFPAPIHSGGTWTLPASMRWEFAHRGNWVVNRTGRLDRIDSDAVIRIPQYKAKETVPCAVPRISQTGLCCQSLVTTKTCVTQ